MHPHTLGQVPDWPKHESPPVHLEPGGQRLVIERGQGVIFAMNADLEIQKPLHLAAERPQNTYDSLPEPSHVWRSLLLLFRFFLRILFGVPGPAGTLFGREPAGVQIVDGLLHLETDGAGPPQEAVLAALRSGAGASSADRRAGGPGRCACRRCPSQSVHRLCEVWSRRLVELKFAGPGAPYGATLSIVLICTADATPSSS